MVKGFSSEMTKRCYECYERVRLDAKKCDVCGAKLGKPDKTGMARKPTDWVGYVYSIILLGGFIYYLYWVLTKQH